MRHGTEFSPTAMTVLGILVAAALVLMMELNPGRYLLKPSSYVPVQNTVPSLQVRAGCSDCNWSSSLSRRLSEGYLRHVVASGLAIDGSDAVEVVIHKIDLVAGVVHASASFGDISLSLASPQPMANRGMSLRQMGADLADKLAAELYR